jgi:hypothetical protein
MATVKVVEDKNTFKLQLDPYEILHDVMSGEQRQLLIESLSCHDDVINCVAEQLIDGYTYNGFAGSWSTSRTTALQQARQKIAENSDYAVNKTIKDMEGQIRSLEDNIKWYRENWMPIISGY